MGVFSNGRCLSTARLDGKTVIVTGANTGIGKETVQDLAARGGEVVLACRSVEKGEAAAEDIRTRLPGAKVVVMRLDLSSLQSVKEFVDQFKSQYSSLHLLINNAGVMMCPKSLSKDGYELQFATNHLGHFLLTLLLLPLLLASQPSRIVNVASKAHVFTNSLCLDDINLDKSYNATIAYGRSKLANILFTLELSKRLKDADVKAVSLHPGVVDTELPRHLGQTIFPGANWLYTKLGWWFMKTPLQGAQTTLHCALDESIKSGAYYDDCKEVRTTAAARNEDMARQLWEKSLEMTNLQGYDPFAQSNKL